jgi:hypothetical protein
MTSASEGDSGLVGQDDAAGSTIKADEGSKRGRRATGGGCKAGWGGAGHLLAAMMSGKQMGQSVREWKDDFDGAKEAESRLRKRVKQAER